MLYIHIELETLSRFDLQWCSINFTLRNFSFALWKMSAIKRKSIKKEIKEKRNGHLQNGEILPLYLILFENPSTGHDIVTQSTVYMEVTIVIRSLIYLRV